MDYCDVIIMGSSSIFLHGEWVCPWEHKHHTHVGPQSHRMHTRREGISSCLRFEAALPELPVLLNPILKERFTPHVCEAPGIGRECAHKGTHTNTICTADAMRNHRRKRRHFGSWNSITVCLISETVLSQTKCSLQLFTTFAPAGGTLLRLRSTIVWVLPHSHPLPLASRRTLYDSRDSHIEDPSKPEFFREERWGSERQRYAWIDGGMKEGIGPMRHLELWRYWEIWSVYVCAHLKSCWLAFGIVRWVCYVQGTVWKITFTYWKKHNPFSHFLSAWISFLLHKKIGVQIKDDKTNRYSKVLHSPCFQTILQTIRHFTSNNIRPTVATYYLLLFSLAMMHISLLPMTIGQQWSRVIGANIPLFFLHSLCDLKPQDCKNTEPTRKNSQMSLIQ